MNIGTVPPAQVRDFWPHIAKYIESSLEYGWNTPEEVLALIEHAHAQCWFAYDGDKVWGVWVTRIEQSERGRFCLVWLAGGERANQWIPLVTEHTEKWAKEQGCENMQVVGRKGWVKKLPDYKWTAVVLRKEL